MTEAKHAAVIGRPIAHSLSPAIHSAAFAEMGEGWDYVAIDCGPDDLPRVLSGMRTGVLSGLSVTMPLKEAVIEHLDDMSSVARTLGAVNCVALTEGRIVGHNTDGDGCCDALEQQGGLGLGGARVLLLGAGGTARAVALALALRGARVAVRNRTTANVDRLVAAVTAHPGVNEGSVVSAEVDGHGAFDALVNATSVGMGTQESPVAESDLGAGMVVLDAVYSPLETRLLRDARSRGARTVDGLWMLIHQARHQEMIWLGRAGSVEVMRAESERVLATRSQ